MDDLFVRLLKLLRNRFYYDTAFQSRVSIDHPYFKTIVHLGQLKPKVVIPFLLKSLKDDFHWTIALEMIIGEEKAPHIPEEYAGRIDYINNLWLDWGRAQGYIITESR